MQPHKITLVSFDGGNASTITGPLEVFTFAADQRSASGSNTLALQVVTKDGRSVTCDGCVTIFPVASIASVESTDLIFLAGMPCDIDQIIGDNSEIMDWVVRQRKKGVAIATVCPSQALLAKFNLLEHKTVAMHWSLIDEVRKRWPNVNWTADRMVMEDQGIYSCCGASAAIDLALYIVDRFCGHNAMVECARWFLTDLPRVGHQVPPPLFGHAKIEDPDMKRVESWLLGHFNEHLHFESLATRFGMSWRTFYRHFLGAFGDPPKVYLQKLRLSAARRLLEVDRAPIDQIAKKVGYEDPAFFRALFKRQIGMTPSRYREILRFRASEGDRVSARNAEPGEFLS